MSMRLSIDIDANGDVAVRSIEKLEGAVKKTGAATQDMGRKGATAAAQTKQVGTSAQASAASVNTLSAAQTRNAATARSMATANNAAAGNMGNLVAQFNDIGVMMAAGQNPLTLALQQGTQISQVIGPMGAAGAVKSLGGAFLGMLNPISLVTIGVIAGGAALTQWAVSAFGAGDASKTFEEHVDDLATATERYREASEIAAMSTAELEAKFGSASTSVRTTLNLLQQLAASDAQRTLDGVANGLADLLGTAGDGDQRTMLADFFDVNIGLAFTDAQREARAEARGLTSEFVGQQNALRTANGDLDQQIAILDRMIGTARQLADATGGRSAAEDALLAKLGDALLKMQQQRGATVDAAQQGKVAYEQYYASRIAGENNLAAIQARELASRKAVLDVYAASRIESDAATASAQAILDDLTAQNAMQQAIAQHGANSAEVAALRAASERQVFDEMLATLDVSQDLKDRLSDAFDVQQDIAAADMGVGIRNATADAIALAQKLNISVALLGRLQALGPQGLGDSNGNVYSGRGGDPRDFGDNPIDRFVTDETDAWITASNRAPRAARSGGGNSEAKAAARELARQREGVIDLIAGLGDEIAILRESDPVQKEMLRNRETLDAATTAERETIEKLIATRNAEDAAIEKQAQLYDSLRDAGKGAFDTLLNNGGDLEAMFNSLTASLADMVFQSMLLGEGPLGDGQGGFLGTIATSIASAYSPANVNAAPLKKAGGGMIYGPGSGTSDDVPAWLSNGEFVATAKATSKYRPYLEAMNAGTFSTGGAVDGSTYVGGAGGVSFAPVISINNQGSTPISGEMREESDGNGGRRYELVLADAVGGALQQPGGGAKRTLRNTYGVRQRGARR